jgi:hypothetical protein
MKKNKIRKVFYGTSKHKVNFFYQSRNEGNTYKATYEVIFSSTLIIKKAIL